MQVYPRRIGTCSVRLYSSCPHFNHHSCATICARRHCCSRATPFSLATVALSPHLSFGCLMTPSRTYYKNCPINTVVAFCRFPPRVIPQAPLPRPFLGRTYDLSSMFCEMFRHLPVCSVIHDKVLVIHGGLFHREGVKLADIDEVECVHVAGGMVVVVVVVAVFGVDVAAVVFF